VYEIAKARIREWLARSRGACLHLAQVKQSDPGSEFVPLESICNSIIGTAKSMGVTVVK
jgi:large subunit ribosomal protein L11